MKDTRLTRDQLRAMRGRWQRDLDRLNAAYPEATADWTFSMPRLETIRNLATAIAEIDGIITSPFHCKGDPRE